MSGSTGIASNPSIIGAYQGRAIPAFIQARGGRFAFERIAIENKDGTVPLSQLRDDELMISPGLIYRKETQ